MLGKKTKKKTGLTVTSISKDHWSIGGQKCKVEGTKLVVTILHGKGLLASDIYNGKSDPVCFLWCGLPSDFKSVDNLMAITSQVECNKVGIKRTKVCPTTLEPIWNEDIVFPLVINNVELFSQMRCIIYIRDEDINTEDCVREEFSFDELGMCEISLGDIIMNGKVGKQSIVFASKQLDLKSSPKMKKNAEGYVKVTCSLIFDENDTVKVFPEIASDIRTLEVFLQRYQRLLRDNFEKENVSKNSWGRNHGGPRNMISRDNTGDITHRSTTRVSSARGRSVHAPSSSSPLDDLMPCTVGRSEEDELHSMFLSLSQISGSDSRQSTTNGQCANVQKSLEDATANDTPPPYTEMADVRINSEDDGYDGGAAVTVSASFPVSIPVPLPVLTSGVHRDPVTSAGTDNNRVGSDENRNRNRNRSRNSTGTAGEVKSSGGNGTAAARALRGHAGRNIPKNVSQQGIDFFSSLSQESVLELSSLLRSKENARRERGGGGDRDGDRGEGGDSSSSCRHSKVSTLDIPDVISPKHSDSSRGGESLAATVSIMNSAPSGRRVKAVSARPDLSEFRKQQQSLRRAKEVRFFESRGLADPLLDKDEDIDVQTRPPSSRTDPSQRVGGRGRQGGSSNSSSSSEGVSVPDVELFQKIPNSKGVTRTILTGDPSSETHPPPSTSPIPTPIHSLPNGRAEITSQDETRDVSPLFFIGGDCSNPDPDREDKEREAESVRVRSRKASRVVVRENSESPPQYSKVEQRVAFASSVNSDTMTSATQTATGSVPCGQGQRGNVNWSAVETLLDRDDAVSAFSVVVERGELEDLARVMQLLGPRPHLLSVSIRNSVYDGIATMLAQSHVLDDRRSNEVTERCLYWVLALFRGDSSQEGQEAFGIKSHGHGVCRQGSLGSTLCRHTRRDIRESLESVSLYKSKKGLLAALLLHYV